MARTARLHLPNSIEHNIARIVNAEYRIVGDAERDAFLARVGQSSHYLDGDPLALCMMSNHVHWARQAGRAPPSMFFRSLHTGYAAYLNAAQERFGPVFAERFRTIVCPEESTALLIAYIHNNPVRAGLVADPADTDWSTHRAYLGLTKPPPWINVELGLSMCGFGASPSGRLAFHDFVRSRAGLLRDPALSGDGLSDTRKRLREATGLSCELSDALVRPESGQATHAIVLAGEGKPRPRWPGRSSEVLELAATAVGVSTEEVQSRSRRRQVVEARRLALSLWSVHLGRAQIEMDTLLGIASGSGSRLLQRRTLVASVELAGMADALWSRFRRVDATGTYLTSGEASNMATP